MSQSFLLKIISRSGKHPIGGAYGLRHGHPPRSHSQGNFLSMHLPP